MGLSYKEVAEILKIIDASDCEEVVLELEGTRMVVRRGGGPGAPGAPGTATAATPSINPAGATPSGAPAGASGAANEVSGGASTAADGAQGTIVRSPMVGTFYRRPSPDEPPYVEQGARVAAGDPLCLIEVMKLYTTIEATVSGVVTSVLADDGMLVEFDQPLFTIDAE